MRWLKVLVVPILCGCMNYDSAATLDFPDARAREALTAWQAQGLPTGTCADEIARMQLVVVPRDSIETDAYCGSENAGMNVLGCFVYDGDAPTIVLRSQLTLSVEDSIEHELRHWMAMCSGYDGTGDPEHDDARMWFLRGLREDWDYRIEQRSSATPVVGS